MSIFRLLRHFRVRPRLVISVLAGVAVWLSLPILPVRIVGSTRAILALDVGGLMFLVLAWNMMRQATPDILKRRARQQDEGRLTILMLTVGAAIFSVAAIGAELRNIKGFADGELPLRVALVAVTIICSWLVTHTMFALHYAHAFYGEGRVADQHAGGLDFPHCERPDYWDFLYFSFVIGMTAQTSDVAVTDNVMRRLALAQGVLAFFFNTVILALSINIAAGLL